MPFSNLPPAVIDYVREVFARANHKVAKAMSDHPSAHEEMLDHILVAELNAAAPVFFADVPAAVVIESHWLGGRRMYGRWEIADLALFVLLSRSGHLVARKVALLQTKRLYTREIAATELDDADYGIGIARLADRTDPIVPYSRQRAFSFDGGCLYGAVRHGSPQTQRIDEYQTKSGIPVFYGFYNPLALPFSSLYPSSIGTTDAIANVVGCRVAPASVVHAVLRELPVGQPPSFGGMQSIEPSWRLEAFVADEVLRCKQGQLFSEQSDPNLNALFFERSAPITAAITIRIDLGAEG